MDKALARLKIHAEAGVALREKFFAQNAEIIRDAAFKTAFSLSRGGKLFTCGNGGSAGDAQHVAGEFINRFLVDRPSLPAVALTTDTSVITAIANDIEYAKIFSRQLEGLARPGDVLLAISTSGNSPNVLEALKTARAKRVFVIGLTGAGGAMIDFCDLLIKTPDDRTPLIQECHLAAEHAFCELVDYFMFENPESLKRALLSPKDK